MRKLERERNRRSISYAAQSNPVQPSPRRLVMLVLVK